MRRVAWIASALVLGAGHAAADDPATDEKRACVDASEHGQELRHAGKLKAARDELRRCVRETCPDVVSTDCRRWLDEVDGLVPTVVLGLRDAAGHDVTDARVQMDGQVLVETLTGQAVPVDPGDHVFRFEPKSGRPLEARAIIREGEKGRAVVVAVPAPPPARPPAPPASERPSAARSMVTYALWGVGLVSVGVGVGLEIKGTTEIDRDRRTCKLEPGGCDPASVDASRYKLLAGDISIAAGVVAAGVATVLFLTRPGRSAASRTATLPFAPP